MILILVILAGVLSKIQRSACPEIAPDISACFGSLSLLRGLHQPWKGLRRGLRGLKAGVPNVVSESVKTKCSMYTCETCGRGKACGRVSGA